ncbi:MAG: HD domain-containing protein, partial [Pyrinomonadaceae bacterium]
MYTTSPPSMLRAKSPLRDGEIISLERHLRETEQAAIQIFRLDGRWGRNWCRFFQIQGTEAQERFLLNLRVAALFHDIGKANEDFYSAVCGAGRIVQTLRHDHLGALILHLPEVRLWLSKNSALDAEVITASVLSHHLKAAPDGDVWRWCQPRGLKKEIRLYLAHSEVTSVFRHIGEIASLAEPPQLSVALWSERAPWAEAYRNGRRDALRFGRQLQSNKGRLSLLLATKAGVIVADAASSGLVREGHCIDDWINEKVYAPAIGNDDIAKAVLKPRAEQISRQRCKPFELHPFQTRTARQGSRVLLLAACAAGKTLAAWKWAEAQAREREIGKVIFLYPTRGTATEGFRDYVGWAPETEGALVHGTSRFELEAMASNPSEATEGKSHGLQ